MSVTYGFYDSLNGDRKYNSKQFSSLFDGVIKDGVFANIGDAFKVSAGDSYRTVVVGTGRAWFNHTWTFNDSPITFVIESVSNKNYGRIDTIVIDVDVTNRTNDIKLIKGAEATYPFSPDLINNSNEGHYQYPICDIHVPKYGDLVSTIPDSSMLYLVGSSRCPFVSSVMDNNMINALTRSWQTEWDHQNAEQQAEFDAFMNDLRTTLTGDQAAALNNKITVLESKTESLSPSAIFNRNTFRGKYLGTTITDSQLSNIRNGSFKDLCIGDYWEHNGIKWRIVDINYWLNTGYGTKCTTNHIVVMPDEPIASISKMNNASAAIDYYNSLARDNMLHAANGPQSVVSNWLGDKYNEIMLIHKEYLVNTMSNDGGLPASGAWYDSTMELPSEIMMYGTRVYGPVATRDVTPCLYTNSRTQLSLFRMAPQYIQAGNSYFWLRDALPNNRYACVGSDGEASWRKVEKDSGIRPVFGITGGAERAEWVIGSDLSGHTLLCNERLTTNTSFDVQYDNGNSEFYNLAGQHGFGGGDVYLKVHLANGRTIDIKDGCYGDPYDTVTACGQVIYKEYNDWSASTAGMTELFNIESNPLPAGSIITSVQFVMDNGYDYWVDDEYAMLWLGNNITIKS